MPITLQQFVDKYKGKKIDWDKAYGAQCFDLYRFYLNEVLGFQQSPPTGDKGAALIWTNYIKDDFIKIHNTPTGVPKPGSIMIWNRYYGPYGHVAVVTKADVNKFTAFSQNDPTGQPCILKEYQYKSIYGWLEPVDKGVDNSDLEACMVDRQKFWSERDAEIEAHKATKREYAGFRDQLADIYGSVHSNESVIKFATENSKVIDERNELQVKYEKEVQARKTDYEKHQVELKRLRGENEVLAKQVKTLSDRIDNAIEDSDEAKEAVDNTIPIKHGFSLLEWLRSIFNIKD